MKTLLVAGILAITAVSAFAEPGNGETWGHQVTSSGPSLTRAQVLAELREAQANNTIAYGEHASKHARVSPRTSVLTRRQVHEDVMAMQQASRFPASGEHSGGQI